MNCPGPKHPDRRTGDRDHAGHHLSDRTRWTFAPPPKNGLVPPSMTREKTMHIACCRRPSAAGKVSRRHTLFLGRIRHHAQPLRPAAFGCRKHGAGERLDPHEVHHVRGLINARCPRRLPWSIRWGRAGCEVGRLCRNLHAQGDSP